MSRDKLDSGREAAFIIKQLKQHLPSVLHNRPVMLVYVYGSVAAGCPTPLSDVDIALVLAPDWELDDDQRLMLEMEIEAEIEKRCGIQDADVRSISDAPLRVQGEVLTQGKLLYSRDEDFRVTYVVRAATL